MNTFILLLAVFVSILIGMSIHELGHFLFAILFKVNVKEFSIGVGPKIFQFKSKSGMLISFRLIPLMAYVMIDNKKTIDLYKDILTEHLNEENDVKKSIEYIDQKSWFKRKWINFKFNKYYSDLNKYKYLSTHFENKLLIDDIALWKKIIIYFGGVLFNLILFGLFWIIVQFGFESPNRIFNPFTILGNSLLNMLKNMVFMGEGPGTSFGDIISGGNSGINGQLTTFDIFRNIFTFLCVFNILLFVYNLLPIPPLDGYKILIEILESVFKFKINKKVEISITVIGYLLLIYIFITSIVADIRYVPPAQNPAIQNDYANQFLLNYLI